MVQALGSNATAVNTVASWISKYNTSDPRTLLTFLESGTIPGLKQPEPSGLYQQHGGRGRHRHWRRLVTVRRLHFSVRSRILNSLASRTEF